MNRLFGIPVRLSLAAVAALLLGPLAGRLLAAEARLALNDREYLEQRGLDVLVFSSEYNGMFFDEKTAGIELVHHGVRTATGGAVRLKPTPEQWDQIPKLVKRTVDKQAGTIEVVLRYEEFDFDSRVLVRSEAQGFSIGVFLDKPLPERLAGRAGLNLEFLPSAYFEKTYLADGRPGVFPLYPSGPMQVKAAATQIRQFAGHTTFDDRGRGEYVETDPIATGRTLVLAPEDPLRRVVIECASGLRSSTGATSRRTAGTSCARSSPRRRPARSSSGPCVRTRSRAGSGLRWSASRRPGTTRRRRRWPSSSSTPTTRRCRPRVSSR